MNTQQPLNCKYDAPRKLCINFVNFTFSQDLIFLVKQLSLK